MTNLRLEVLAALAVCLAAGCTTLQSAELSPDVLQAQLRDYGGALAGDRIGIVAADGQEHVLRVSAVVDDELRGETAAGDAIAVPIEDIVALRTKRVHVGRTTLAVVALAPTAFFALLVLLTVAESA